MTARKLINLNSLRAMYRRGDSVLAMAKAFGVSRPLIARNLTALGLPIRTGSEANRLRMARLTAEERLALARAAHNAVRGSRRTDIEQITRAKSVQVKEKLSSLEARFYKYLTSLGIKITPLMAIHRYNIDLACADARVAIEVNGSWHTQERKALQDARKAEYLCANGWIVTYLTKDNADTSALRAIAELCKCRTKLLSHPHQ